MKKPSADEVVNKLMNDPAYYQKMSAKEGQVWGKIFSDEKRNEAVRADQAAAQKLGINRGKISLIETLKKHDLHPKAGLSLACGGGRAERMYMKAGICQTFHGVDIAADALKEAEQAAKAENLNITYEQADLNHLQLKPNAFDLCVTQNCLHHVLRLEDLAKQIHDSLRPDGVLWIHDYIGETQFQYTAERMEIVNRLLAILPEDFRQDRVNQRLIPNLARRDPGNLVSPFEAIRSADIMPVFLTFFDVIEKQETDSVIGLVCPLGARSNYLKNDESKTVFELLLYIDELLIRKGILPARAGVYLLRPRKRIRRSGGFMKYLKRWF